MIKFLKKQSPARLIAMGFALVILLGSLLLMLPCSQRDTLELSYIDALYTATSAVCVTGLVVVDTFDSFTAFGQTVIAVLIQIGGLSVAVMGAGIILAAGKKMDFKFRNLVKTSMGLNSGGGVIRFIKGVFMTTLIFELAGAALSFIVFVQDFPLMKAIGVSVFHSIASFNNAGFDILGNMQNMIPYQQNIFLNIVTAALVFFGGIGFLVIWEIGSKGIHWKKYSMHAKVVLSTSAVLIVGGMLLLKLTENISWLGAFFTSVSARTAGFSTYSLGEFSKAGLAVIIVLMVIGASPGSTGGGIKTSTLLVLIQGVRSAATNKVEKAFRYSIPKSAFRKAAVLLVLALTVIITGTYLFCVLEPDISFMDALFEVTSALGTVGLSTGITPGLGLGAKIVTIFIMYIGRLGPLTIASLWYFSIGERARFPEGNIAVG